MSKKSRPEGTIEVAERVAKDTASKEIRATLHRGPLPSPEQMEKYEKLWPGATEFFFEQFKKQTDHRQNLEKKVISSNISATKRGQWMAYTLFLIVAIGGFALLFLGKEVSGIIMALGGLIANLTLFFTRRKATDQALYNKEHSNH